MKLVIGSYVLDGVSSTAYEQFITYYQNTPASYITNQDIERWNTPADLSDLASKSYVIDKIGAIPAPNLSAYATVSYVTDNFIEIEKSIASAVSYVNNKVDNIDIPEPDLTPYVTYSYLQDKNYLTQHQDLSDYVTKSFLNEQSYLTQHQDLSAYTKFEDIASMGYITEHQDLSSYATVSYVTDNFVEIEKSIASVVSYVNNKIDNIDIPEPDLSSYATQSYVMEKVQNITVEVDTTGFVDETRLQDYVLGAIAAHNSTAQNNWQSYTTSNINALNISSYATKDWVTEHITEIATGGTVTLDGYATELWVNNQGFLKQHQSLANYVTSSILSATLNSYMKKSDMSSYATQEWVNTAILNAAVGEVDLSNYALKSEIPSLTNYYNKTWIDSNFASKDYVTERIANISSGGTVSLDGYATETWVSNHFLGNSALGNYYTKSQVDAKIPSLANYITFDWIEGYYNQYVKDYCDTFNTDGTNLLNYVSKSELNGLSYVTTDYLSSLGYITQHQSLDDYVSKTDLNNLSYATVSYVTEELSKSEKVIASAVSYISDKVESIGSIVIPEVDLSSYATISYVTDKISSIEANGGVDLSSYALKSELPFVCYNGAYILSYSYNNRASDSWEVGEGSVVIFKHSLNYNTKTGTGAVAIGDRVTALGQHSLAIGNQASTNANWSIASGFASQARGESSIALGRYVKTYDTGSAAVGMYNNATSGVSLFTVGDGTADNARHNALEITLNGYSYISKPCISYNAAWSEISYETWSFTLQDDSVVTKKILMF